MMILLKAVTDHRRCLPGVHGLFPGQAFQCGHEVTVLACIEFEHNLRCFEACARASIVCPGHTDVVRPGLIQIHTGNKTENGGTETAVDFGSARDFADVLDWN